MLIKELIKRIVKQEKYNSATYINFLRKRGIAIGDNCDIFSPVTTYIDCQNPHMIKIGNNVKIAEGSKLLTHDFSWCVSSNIDGLITGSVGEIEIGNNVFIGMNSIITSNVKIGNNVIIGAGSIVTKNCEDGFVYAGVPAKKLMTIQEYHERRIAIQKEAAIKTACQYIKRFGHNPPKEVLREFIYLFEGGDSYKNDQVVEQILKDSGHYEKCLNKLKNNKPMFENYEKFIEYCNLKNSED